MYGGDFFVIPCRKISDGVQGETIEPGFEGESLGLLASIAQGASDGLVNDFVLGDGVGGNLLVGLSVREFAFDKALETRKIDVHVGADVVGGDGGCMYRSQGRLKWDLGFEALVLDPAPARPLASVAELSLVLVQL